MPPKPKKPKKPVIWQTLPNSGVFVSACVTKDIQGWKEVDLSNQYYATLRARKKAKLTTEMTVTLPEIDLTIDSLPPPPTHTTDLPPRNTSIIPLPHIQNALETYLGLGTHRSKQPLVPTKPFLLEGKRGTGKSSMLLWLSQAYPEIQLEYVCWENAEAVADAITQAYRQKACTWARKATRTCLIWDLDLLPEQSPFWSLLKLWYDEKPLNSLQTPCIWTVTENMESRGLWAAKKQQWFHSCSTSIHPDMLPITELVKRYAPPETTTWQEGLWCRLLKQTKNLHLLQVLPDLKHMEEQEALAYGYMRTTPNVALGIYHWSAQWIRKRTLLLSSYHQGKYQEHSYHGNNVVTRCDDVLLRHWIQGFPAGQRPSVWHRLWEHRLQQHEMRGQKRKSQALVSTEQVWQDLTQTLEDRSTWEVLQHQGAYVMEADTLHDYHIMALSNPQVTQAWAYQIEKPDTYFQAPQTTWNPLLFTTPNSALAETLPHQHITEELQLKRLALGNYQQFWQLMNQEGTYHQASDRAAWKTQLHSRLFMSFQPASMAHETNNGDLVPIVHLPT